MSKTFTEIENDNNKLYEIVDEFFGPSANAYLRELPFMGEGSFRANKKNLMLNVFKKISASDIAAAIAEREAEKEGGLFILPTKEVENEEGQIEIREGDKLQINPTIYASLFAEGKLDLAKYKAKVREVLDGYNFLYIPAGKQREIQVIFYNALSDTFDTGPVSAQQMQKEALGSVLSNFTVNGKGIGYASLVKRNPIKTSDISFTEKGKNNYLNNERELQSDLNLLIEVSSQFTPMKSRLNGFIRKLEFLKDASRYELQTVEVDLLVGSLSLKSMDRREKIYSYWEKKHKEFDAFIDVQDKFIEKILKTFSNHSGEPIVKLFQELNENKLTEEDNYIVSVPSQKIKKNTKDYEAILLLEKFLSGEESDLDLVFSDVDDDDFGEDPEYRGIDPEGEQSVTMRGRGEDESRTETERIEINLNQSVAVSLVDGLDKIQKLEDVDPLYAYAFSQGAFENVPLFLKDISKLKRRVRKGGSKLRVPLDESELEQLDKYIESLADDAYEFKGRKSHFLPLTTKVKTEFKIASEDKISDKLKRYFELVYSLVDVGDLSQTELTTNIGTGEIGAGKKTRKTRYESFVAGRKGEGLSDIFDNNRKSDVDDDDITELINDYEMFIDVLIDSMVRPLQSEYMPFDETKLEFITNRQLNGITKAGNKSVDALHTLLQRIDDIGTGVIPVKAIRLTAELLENLGNVKPGENIKSFQQTMEQLVKQLDKIYDFRHTDEIEQELGAALYQIKQKNNLDIGLELKGTDVKKLHDKYESSRENKIFPLAALVKTLKKEEGRFRSDKRISGRKQDRGLASSKTAEEGKGKYNDLIGRVIQSYDNLLRKKILVKSELEYKVLEAHDSIRKMMDKPIYYGLGDIEDFSDISKTIDIAKEDYSINLTALDIENIYSDFGAYKDIGTKYGVPSEVVYFVKANFR